MSLARYGMWLQR